MNRQIAMKEYESRRRKLRRMHSLRRLFDCFRHSRVSGFVAFSIAVLSIALAATTARAQAPVQLTNLAPLPPATRLESLETNIAVIVIKTSAAEGTLSVDSATITVDSREMTDASNGRKEQGVAIQITARDRLKNTTLIDYDEIVPLLNAINYLRQMEVSETALDTFDASYTTRSGFRISAFGGRRTGAVRFSFRDIRLGTVPIVLSRDDLARFASFMTQAKTRLDSLRGR